jgi:Ca2+-transporting ATPase
MLWFLLCTAVLYAALGEVVESATLFGAVLPLAGMDAFLHRRTQASTEGLKSRLADTATVVREDRELAVQARELVPGDLVAVGSGEPFPADGIVVSGDLLRVDESTLTGESSPVHKRPLPDSVAGSGDVPVDAVHWGFAGTRLLTGRALLRVVFTDGETLYGEIVRSARAGTRERTPLQVTIAALVRVLVVVAIVFCLILAFVRLSQGHGWVDALVSALTLAVAALPEEFPVVFTFFLGVGVYRMAQRQALMRRAVAVENIGRVSCICSDKTGTITEGRLHLTHLFPVADQQEMRLLHIALSATRPDSHDPLDVAIIREARARGIESSVIDTLALFPFTEDSRRQTAVVREKDAPEGVALAAMKGAPETVLGMVQMADDARAAWLSRTADLAADGHKIIACAWRQVDVAWPGGEPQRGYELAGLLAFEDPVREGVAEAIAACREGGIHVVMITGDHVLTARAVAQEIGLGGGKPRVVPADEMEDLLASGGGRAIRAIDVVARAVPAQKLSLVRALQQSGEIVVVTGDGVNDVPALQAADIGVAMGERGTRSAREVASIVLLDDNFRTIVRAIAEGQQLFRNLRLSFQYLLMIHVPLVISAAFIPLLGYPVLYLPVHIIWLELTIHPTALLVFQSLPARGALGRSIGDRQVHFFSRRDWVLTALVGGFLTLMVSAGYSRSLGPEVDVLHARAMALALLTLASAAIAAALSRLSTPPSRVIVFTTLAVSTLLIQTPFLAGLLHLRPLHFDDWLVAGTGALVAVSPLLLGWGVRRGSSQSQ